MTKRCGSVAILGAPNAGKSTLINALVGAKVSIVSPKVQTTRTRVLGIVIEGESQIIFIDTPGIFQPSSRKRLERAMVAAAWDALSSSDIIAVIVDASLKNPLAKTEIILKRLEQEKASEIILVLNKIDNTRKDRLLDLAAGLNSRFQFKATFMISALSGDGIKDMVKYLASNMPEGDWHYPEDQISDMPMRLLAAEITREKLFEKLYQELPHALTVETETWEDFKDGSLKITQTIYIERDSQKSIILGKGGQMIKTIGESSRHEIEDILERKVHLSLFVKVREDWSDDPDRLTLWGLDHKA